MHKVLAVANLGAHLQNTLISPAKAALIAEEPKLEGVQTLPPHLNISPTIQWASVMPAPLSSRHPTHIA